MTPRATSSKLAEVALITRNLTRCTVVPPTHGRPCATTHGLTPGCTPVHVVRASLWPLLHSRAFLQDGRALFFSASFCCRGLSNLYL